MQKKTLKGTTVDSDMKEADEAASSTAASLTGPATRAADGKISLRVKVLTFKKTFTVNVKANGTVLDAVETIAVRAGLEPLQCHLYDGDEELDLRRSIESYGFVGGKTLALDLEDWLDDGD